MQNDAAYIGDTTQQHFYLRRVFARASITFRRQATPIIAVMIATIFPFALYEAFNEAATASDTFHALAITALSCVAIGLAGITLVHAASEDMTGRPLRLGESLKNSFWRYRLILVQTAIVVVCVLLGLLLLIIPGLVLMAMWGVAIQVSVIEKTGPLRSLTRSRELTRGYRFKILLISAALPMIGLLPELLSLFDIVSVQATTAGTVLIVFAKAFWMAFSCVLMAATYHELLAAKRHASSSQRGLIEDTFDTLTTPDLGSGLISHPGLLRDL